MGEREIIRELKEAGAPKPWSDDLTMQTTYFCNVNRENDRVTRWIRNFYCKPLDNMFEVNIGFARLINRIETLDFIGYIGQSRPFGHVQDGLEGMQAEGRRVFGDAYIVSTNGRSMGKAAYVCEMLLPALYAALGPQGTMAQYPSSPTLEGRYKQLRGVYGLGSFMAGQLLADFKNTVGHPLAAASDKDTWATHGPGSLRGLGWIFGCDVRPSEFMSGLTLVREILYNDLKCIVDTDNQDLQNCLCEFDKFMRVSTGAGRSKRKYNGTN
jgi:5-hmdU DNA kinase-like protein